MGSIAPALLRRVLHTRPHDPGHLPFWEGHLVHGARAAPLLAATRPACTTGGLLAQEAQLTNGSRVSTRSGEHRPHCCSPALTAVHEEVHVVRRGRAWPHNGTRTSCWPIGCAQSIVSNAHAQARNALKGSGVHCVRRAEPRPVAQWCDPFSAHASNAQKGSGAHCVQRPELRSATQWCDSFSACTPGLLGCAS